MTVALAAPSTVSAEAGLSVARAGGCAVDVALAATIAAMATEPGIVSPMGGGFVAVWPSAGEPVVIDGNVEMPGRGRDPGPPGPGLREVTTTYGGGLTMYAGPASVATPGAFAALDEAHARYGRVCWADLLAPAVRAAREGYRLGGAAASYLAVAGPSVFGWDPETAALVLDQDGQPRPSGSLVRDLALADSLELVAGQGAADLYTGQLGARFVADQQARGGRVTAADLAAYRPLVRPALRVQLGDWDLATNPPPSIGGPVLAVMLGALATREALEVSDVVEVQRAVLTYRRGVLDHSSDLLGDARALLDRVAVHGLAGLQAPSTVHISAVDADGTACAVTMSSGYGSGATVPGTGLMLNNCLGEPELNRRGLYALAPGTRLGSNMAPTVGRRGDARLAVGSPGADRITTALTQVLARFCLQGMPLAQAIERPRLHVSVDEEGRARLDVERDGGLDAAVDRLGLASVGHPRHSMYFGGVGAAMRDEHGRLTAAADPRREAATGVG